MLLIKKTRLGLEHKIYAGRQKKAIGAGFL
jgi:hypothetical protein